MARRYREVQARPDVESLPIDPGVETLPQSNGMLVHAEYTFYGHFAWLREQLAGVEKVRFYLDQESGIRGACLGIFADRIQQREARRV